MRVKMTFSNVIDGYLLYAESRQRSTNTLAEYLNTFAKFGLFIGIDEPPELTAQSMRKWVGTNSKIHKFDEKNLYDIWQLCLAHRLIDDVDVASISHQAVERFLASFDKQKISKKTILNYHVGLSSLWRWLDKESFAENIMRLVDPPKPKQKIVKPYTEDEIRRLLVACQYNAAYTSKNGVSANRRQSEMRDVGLILLLVDSGIRSEELCNLNVRDVDIKGRRLLIRAGKGDKERYAYFSARTGRVLWRWLVSRDDKNNPNAPMFITRNYTRITKSGLLQFVKRAGNRAGIVGANVHRFRHTFAIQSLRNGMSAYVLQDLLGHSSMDMVRRYLRVAEVDLSNGHHHASPVDNWRL